MNERVKGLTQELGAAIDEAVTASPKIESIMQAIRDCGYEVYLMLEANIAVEDKQKGEAGGPAEDRLTTEDLRFLKQLKIRF